MNYRLLALAGLILFSGVEIKAGKGAAIGVGAGATGFILGSALANRRNSYYDEEEAEIRRLKRQNRRLRRELRDEGYYSRQHRRNNNLFWW